MDNLLTNWVISFKKWILVVYTWIFNNCVFLVPLRYMYLWLTTYWLYKLSYSNHMSVFISEWGESTPCVYIYYVSDNTWHNSPIWIGNPWNSISFKREYCMKKSTLCQIYFILVSTFQLLVEIKRNYWRVIFLENSILKNIEYMNKLNYYIMLYYKSSFTLYAL